MIVACNAVAVSVRMVFICAILFALAPFAHAAEYIESFSSDITVLEDASFSVDESITYVFDERKHGIFRCIPTLHQDQPSSPFKERIIDIAVTGVSLDGGNAVYAIDDGGDQVCIKIGDPNATITGKHLYRIEYHVGGALTYEEYGGADLYWNVTGHGWNVPILSAEAHINGEGLLLANRSCYRGAQGETHSCETVSEASGTVMFASTQLAPHDGMTIAQALDRAKIPLDVREQYKSFLLGIIAGIIGLCTLGYALFRYKTKYKTNKPIIAQYEPYPDVKPIYMGVLFDGRLDPRDISACIVYLAQQGFLKITKTEKKVFFLFDVDDYTFSITKQLGSTVGAFERRVLTLLFSTVQAVDNFPIGLEISLSALKESVSAQEKNAQELSELRTELSKDLISAGFFQENNRLWVLLAYITGISAVLSFVSHSVPLFFFIGIPLAIVVTLMAYRRRTRKGYEALDHLKGFKEYLRVTESQRYIFHNAPSRNAEHFMEYLPYAIAFGVEKEWAKAFEGITIPNPSWYDGGSVGSFSATSLTESVGAFSSALASTSAGGSASSGGGSSGGGSGGGGGGSW